MMAAPWSPGDNLGRSFGCRDKEHIERWLNALHAGYARARRCEVMRPDGRFCRGAALRGQDRCRAHLRGARRSEFDLGRLPKLRHLAETRTGTVQERARRAIQCIERRMLHRRWLIDPNEPGTTLVLSDGDERMIRQVLFNESRIDLAIGDGESGQAFTPRCIDRLRHAARNLITAKSDREGYRRRVKTALRDERAFWRADSEPAS
jgi:hypothetical protein